MRSDASDRQRSAATRSSTCRHSPPEVLGSVAGFDEAQHHLARRLPLGRVVARALRGLTTWRGGDTEGWSDFGAEQAAEIVVWALMDRPVWPVYLDYRDCADLTAGYEALTGTAPLHGYTDYCGETRSAATA